MSAEDPHSPTRTTTGRYAGIGSRGLPSEMYAHCQYAAEALYWLGWTLRSGHAPGADQAFEAGAGRKAEVYLPWPGFEPDVPIEGEVFDSPTTEAVHLAMRLHPHAASLKQGTKKLHGRNAHQILGPDLQTPVAFVLCWTPDGSCDGQSPESGGTGQALRIAAAHDIPVFNLQRNDHRWRVERMIEAYIAQA